MDNAIFPKASFLMKIICMKKVGNEEGEEPRYEVDSAEYIKAKSSDFKRSLAEDKANGVEREIEICYSEPRTFKFNTIYMLADRSKVWVYTLGE